MSKPTSEAENAKNDREKDGSKMRITMNREMKKLTMRRKAPISISTCSLSSTSIEPTLHIVVFT